MTNFSGGIAVITGGGSGFGREFAHVAARMNMKLVLADVQQDALDATRAELEKLGAQVLTMRVDVSKAAEIDALAEATVKRFGTPQLLFNNAGVGTGGLIWEHTVAEWDWVLGVDLMGVVHGIRAFVPRMLEAAKADANFRGHIINTASMAGLLTAPNMGVYNVAKHGVVALSETLYQDLRLVTDQVSASVLCPYFVPTGIANSGRNRPQAAGTETRTKSQQIAQAMSDKAVSSGKVSAEEVAQNTFDAIAKGDFYIYSHPQALGNVASRMSAIVEMRNPPDPFAARPDIGDKLRAQLRGTA